MDDVAKREILDAFNTAIVAFDEKSAERHGETHALVEKVLNDQVHLRGAIDGLTLRVEALEKTREAHEHRLSGHDRSITDGVAEAKRHASELRHEIDGTLAGAEQRYEELAGALHSVKETGERTAAGVEELSTNLESAVLGVLAKHVRRIEEAANRLTKTPQVRTAAAVAGTFAGSAAVATLFELLRALHVIR